MNEREIFTGAMERVSEAERAAFLDDACRGDTALRERIEALLREQDQLGSFLEMPPAAVVRVVGGMTIDAPSRGMTTDAPSEQPGAAIGPYRFLERIGEGGMGEVWMAEQQEPMHRMVALKIIKAGMDTRQVVARFEAERQALALMDHPNIARVLDGGATDDGRPYFVMELVQGTPITRYCDEHRLTLRERLELFLPVCQAIQHAHQKGIIHRDIKPANVLIAPYDGRPVPKIIDFGVAKAIGQRLTEHTLYTGFGTVVGTLEYMSPEQAELTNQDIDTRSDIYALGVLLYELLTGSTPLDRQRLTQAALLDMLRVIREDEPPKPSTRLSDSKEALPSIAAQRQTEPAKLTKLVHGELDWIVMKALEKDRNRRYGTANGLAQDIVHYLHDEPVQACPPDAWYRFGKFARRNKTALAVAGLALFFLIVLGAVGGWVLRDRAARRHEAEGKVLEALKAAEPQLQRGLPWDPDLIAAVQRVEAQLDDGFLGPEMRRRAEQLRRDVRMLAALDEIRLWQARSNQGAMFDLAGAEKRYAEAFAEYGVDVTALGPADAANRIRAAAISDALVAGLDAWMLATSLEPTERARLRAVADGADDNAWRRSLRAAALAVDVPRLKALAGQEGALAQPPRTLAWLGWVLADAKLANEAETLLRQAQARYPGDFWINYTFGKLFMSALSDAQHAKAEGYFRAAAAVRPDSAEAWRFLGLSLAWKNDFDGGIAALRQAIALDPKMPNAHVDLARTLQRHGQRDQAMVMYRKAVQLAHDLPETQRDLDVRYAEAHAHCLLGDLLQETGQVSEAMEAWRLGTRLMEKVIAESGGIMVSLRSLATWKEKLAGALAESGRPQETVVCLGVALSAWEKWVALSNTAAYRERLAGCATKLGGLLERLGRLPESEDAYRKALAVWEKLVADYPYEAGYHGQYGGSCHRLANLLERAGRHDEAQQLGRQTRVEWDRMAELNSNPVGFHIIAAWDWINCPEPKCRDIPRATEILQARVKKAPADGDAWNALGGAYYRAGNLQAACSALALSMAWRQGGRASDWFFLAMARWQLGKEDEATRWYALAQRWMDEHQPAPDVLFGDDPYGYEDLPRLRSEAAALLGLPESMASSRRPGQSLRLAAADLWAEVDPTAEAYENRGQAYAELGQWDKAAADFTRLVELDPHRIAHWLFLALARLGTGDTPGYRSACARMLEVANTDSPLDAQVASWVCVVAPGGVTELATPLRLAERSLVDAPSSISRQQARGAALYRAGRFEEAARQLAESQTAWRSEHWQLGYTWALLAMVHHRLGHPAEARKWLGEAVNLLDQTAQVKGNGFDAPHAMPWHRRLELQLLCHEARALIAGADEGTSSSGTRGNPETTTVAPRKPAH